MSTLHKQLFPFLQVISTRHKQFPMHTIHLLGQSLVRPESHIRRWLVLLDVAGQTVGPSHILTAVAPSHFCLQPVRSVHHKHFMNHSNDMSLPMGPPVIESSHTAGRSGSVHINVSTPGQDISDGPRLIEVGCRCPWRR